jgi:seryl-tRNA synthetase
MCLTGTAEIPIGGYFMGRVYEEKELPVKVVAFGRCFRAEAGAYGGVWVGYAQCGWGWRG